MPQRPIRPSQPESNRPARYPRAVEPGETRRKDIPPGANEHEGATEDEIGDRTGPGAGYDKEPEQVKDPGGVS